MTTPRKTLAGSKQKSSDSTSLTVVRMDDGRFSIGGTDERYLVSKRASVATKSAPKSTRNLTADQIKGFTKRMKVAA